MSDYTLPIVCGIIYCGIMGALIGAIRNVAMLGFLLGMACGPFGWIIIACMPKEHRPAGRGQAPEK